MNKGIFRLVFDARRGMRVPAAECARGRGKQTARGGSRLAAAATLSLVALTAHAARPMPGSSTVSPAFNLPQAAGNFDAANPGRVAYAVNGTRMTVSQADARVIANWSNFDVGRGYTVFFDQKNTTDSILNNIGSAAPSVILGAIQAKGEVILYNANGVLFGRGATVNTGSLVATTLKIADDQYRSGFREIVYSDATKFKPTFQAADSEIEGFVRVEAGASITATAPRGDILIFAPRVLNEGRLSAPGGQVVLAAGQKVYLAPGLDPAARGLLVEVDPFATGDKDYNTVENAARGTTPVLDAGQVVDRVNEIVTERGTISMVGLSVKQMGTARATTAVKGENGAIYLLAHGGVDANSWVKRSDAFDQAGNSVDAGYKPTPAKMGELTVGAQSVTRVDPDKNGATQFDAEAFYNSIVRLEGKLVHLEGGARIVAPGAGGVATDSKTSPELKRGVSIVATANPKSNPLLADSASTFAPSGNVDESRIVIDPGAVIDVSGARVDLPMSRNVLTGRLFAINMADSPLQRTGALYRQEVSFDRRKGIKVANASDLYNVIARSADEKLTAGGRIAIAADGAVVAGQGSRLDVSGGAINYAGGEIKTSQLRLGNRRIDIGDAQPGVLYDEVITPAKGRYESAYVEGKNAGELIAFGRAGTVLDGTLAGNAVAGRYQRGGAAGARPLAGRLQVGSDLYGGDVAADYYVSRIVLSQGGAPALAAGFFADPFNASLGGRADTATLSAQAIEAGGFGRVDFRTNGLFQMQPGATLNLGTGGTLSVTANRVEIDGSVRAPSGTIALKAAPAYIKNAVAPAGESVVLSADASLSTAGLWTNDSTRGAASVDAPVATDGGSISLAAYDSVVLPAGAALDVSAGAWRNGAGKTSYGKAGDLSLAANVDVTSSTPAWQTGTVTLNGSVSGFGFTGGGSLTLKTLDLTVSDSDPGKGLWLKPAFFSANGFKTISLSSIRDLAITDNTTVEARLANRVLNPGAVTAKSDEAVAAISHIASAVELDAVKREAVDMSFAATRKYLPAVPDVKGADLNIGQGARVATEAGGKLAFSAGRNLTLAGTLEAPGGTVTLTVAGKRGGGDNGNSDDDKTGFQPTQALWLTPTASINVAGTVEYANSANGLRSGKAYGGGTVTLDAQHGYLVAEAGSKIDLGGFETTLDLYNSRTSSTISRDAGTLNLNSPEGIFVDSTINAKAPSARAAGGTLNVSVSLNGITPDGYPSDERRIVLRQAGAPLTAGLRPGDNLYARLGNGVARLSAGSIAASGFDSVKMRADDRIDFAENVTLSLPRSLTLDTRIVSGQGNAAVSLAAPYVALGDLDIKQVAGMASPSATGGSAGLAVTADLIDVVGAHAYDGSMLGFAFQGFGNTSLSATRNGRRDGEIRLSGRAFSAAKDNATSIDQAGWLRFAGQLDLTAGQIYTSTLSRFEIAGNPGDSVLRTHAPAGGSTSAAPLSAFGKLTLTADTIEHGGVIRVPFGDLALNAGKKLSLAADSELSVSGDGLTVPVGTTVNGSTWYYYPLGNTADTQPGDIRTITKLPVAKQVVLNAGKTATVDISPRARVSAAGGGDVQAAEFVAGVGGSKDYLATTKGLYAVLPGYQFGYAPYDAQIYSGNTDVKPGDQIVITMAGGALAPGRYTLLPAAYGLIPGALLVSKAADQGTSPLASALTQTDGSVVVTGYRTAAGAATVGDDYQRYVVEPAATFRAKSQYNLATADAFLTRQAKTLGNEVGSLTQDAGRISLVASQLPNWLALFNLTAPAGARGGEFDLAVQKVVMVKNGQAASAGHTAADGYTEVNVDSLAATGAASVLIGGTRSGSGSSVDVATVSDQVRVETDVRSNELLLAASQKIDVADNVSIAATGAAGTAAGTLNLSGDGAFLRVSNRKGVDVVRTGAVKAGGDLTVGRKAILSGAQVDMDATGKMSLDNSAQLAADVFSLGAQRISFGGASPKGDSVVVDGTLLATLGGASGLTLRSYSTIDFLASQDLALNGTGKLVLDAAAIRGLGGAGSKVNLSAAEVLLRNSGATLAATDTETTAGTLNIEAHPPLRDGKTGGMEIGAGNTSLGFDKATLVSKGDMVFSGTGKLSSKGDLDLTAQRVTAANGADQAVAAGGVLTVKRPDGGHSLGEQAGLGAKLALSGERVVQNGTIDLAGGRLEITAANAAAAKYAVEFGTGSVTRAGGFSVSADGVDTFGDAGSVAVAAATGAVKVDGKIDVAALAGGGSGGQLKVSATGAGGTLELGDGAAFTGAAGTGGKGGSFTADLTGLPTAADGKIDGIAKAAADFGHKFDLRVRSGDVTLAAQQVKAETVAIAADAGKLTVTSTIDARAPQGGVVQLAAGNDMTLGAGGNILAASSRAGANGGDVLLASTAGTVKLAAGSTVDAGEGRVVLRAARGTASVKVARIAGAVTAGQVSIEAVKTYSGYSSLVAGATSGAKLGQNTILADNATYMADKATILTTLGVDQDSRFHLRPGVDIAATGNFEVTNDWNLYSSSRVGGEPGFLTIRSGGDLNVKGTISDGFNGVARNSAVQSGDAWSLRLAAGADLTGANLLATTVNTAAGDLTVAGGKLLRTTSGSIEMAAGRNIALAGTTAAPATVMVTGTPSANPAGFTAPTVGSPVFTSKGGRIAAIAGANITSPLSDQTLINNWFFHTKSPVAWWSRFDLFRHGFGSFGGGNITLAAGGNIQDVGAFAPTSGRLVPGASAPVVENGGDVEVTAGGNIAGGSFFVGRGQGSLKAGGSIAAGTAFANNLGGQSNLSVAPVLALMDGNWSVRARGDVAISAAFNPTAFIASKSFSTPTKNVYYTYGDSASLDIASTKGDVSWQGIRGALNDLGSLSASTSEKLNTLGAEDQVVFYVAPPKLRISAFAGDINIGNTDSDSGLGNGGSGLSLYASAAGNLEMYAGGDIAIHDSIRVLDSRSLAGVANPNNAADKVLTGGGVKGYNYATTAGTAMTNLHAGDKAPLHMHAEGSIKMADQAISIFSPKQAVITAGQDIVDLSFMGQHHQADDATLIAAGRNITSDTINGSNGLITLAGPGSLQVRAGRQLDLGASAGIETTGNQFNSTLPAAGASVQVAAGLVASPDAAGLRAFADSHRDQLVAYVGKTLRQGDGVSYGYDDALALFAGFSDKGKIDFVKTALAEDFGRTYLAPGKAYAAAWAQAAADAGVSAEQYSGRTFDRMRGTVLFEELRLAGIAGSAAKGGAAKEAGYAPGYAAIDLAGYGAPFVYTGDINLVQSKVQTKSGGDIEFVAPGGMVNVGLSADVSTANVTKNAADRGVVTFAGGSIRSFSEGDFQVNSQKVFAIGTGDILLWSSNANIDSGKGSNNAVAVPPLRVTIDSMGKITRKQPPPAVGSGIGILDAPGQPATGTAYLFAPRGEVIATDAYIRAPMVYFDPEKIRGADNVLGAAANPVSTAASISVGGLGGVVSQPTEPTNTINKNPDTGPKEKNSILTVEVLAMGDGTASVEETAEERKKRAQRQ